MSGAQVPAELPRALRIAAFAWCVRDGAVLLVRLTVDGQGDDGKRWTLPGGGLGFGEHPEDGARREVAEETGLAVELDGLLGVHSIHWPRLTWDDGRDVEAHGVRIVYRGVVVGGELRDEPDGSTDRAEWVPLDRVAALPTVELVDAALKWAGLAGWPAGRLS